jgi:hypothetical protein
MQIRVSVINPPSPLNLKQTVTMGRGIGLSSAKI